jgi:hypothetical protein
VFSFFPFSFRRFYFGVFHQLRATVKLKRYLIPLAVAVRQPEQSPTLGHFLKLFCFPKLFIYQITF